MKDLTRQDFPPPPPASPDILEVITSFEGSSTVLYLKSINEDDIHGQGYSDLQDIRVDSNQKVVMAQIDR